MLMHDERLGTWEAGEIGTTAWVREQRTARYGTADGTAQKAFEATAPVGVTGERVEQRTSSYVERPPAGERQAGMLKLLARERQGRQERLSRRAVMREARRVERERRASLWAAQSDTEHVTPLDALRADEQRGLLPRDGMIVAEKVTLRDLDGHGATKRTTWVEARGAMVKLERLFLDYSEKRRYWQAMVRHLAHDGRSPLVTPTDEHLGERVNGTEIRVTERWHGTPKRDVRGTNGRTLDWTCWTWNHRTGDLIRRPFVPPTQEEDGTSSTSSVEHGTSYAARLALLGADTSLADG